MIPPMNIGKALGIGRLDNVQDVFRIGRLENCAPPPPALDRVACKVEDDGDTEAQEFGGEGPDHVSSLRGCPPEISD